MKPQAVFPWLKPLGTWFAREKRAMPWRGTRDPYRVWLSEVMLQQTQVATVIPYYEKFLKQFPTVEALAAAPLDDVLKLWAGLGYYSRARNLHRAAQKVAAEHGGKFPATLEAISEIPGIGAYTAGAVLSIAYGKVEALVDGNVARVLSRVMLLEGDWRGGVGKRAVWDAARKLVADAAAQKIDPGTFNQALMELGATICSPRSPDCSRCPIAKHCRANKDGRQAEFPQLKVRAESPEWHLRAWIVRGSGGKILFAQREASGLFGGLWELPTERLAVAPRGAKHPHGIPVASIKQVLTHRVLNIDALEIARAHWDARAKKPGHFVCWSGSYDHFEWLKPDAARSGGIALHAGQLRILALYADKSTLFD